MANATSTPAGPAIPPDDVTRRLTLANPDDANARHISVAGGTYTILVSGEETGGRYSLIDMLIPPGGGPPPHRHDFEEMFTILEGEIELIFRGAAHRASAGSTVNIPAHALHVHAGGAGGVLHGSRRSRRQPHRAAAKAQSRRAGRAYPAGQVAFGQISHRAVGVKFLLLGTIGASRNRA